MSKAKNPEVFVPMEIDCEVGEVRARVLVLVDFCLRTGGDDIEAYVEEPCRGCQRWTDEEIARVMKRAQKRARRKGDNFGIHSRTGEELTYCDLKDRVPVLEQYVIDSDRFMGVDGEGIRPRRHKLMVYSCEPFVVAGKESGLRNIVVK